MPLKQGQDDLIFLRHIQAQRNLPRQFIILPSTESEVKTAFAIYKPGEVVSDGIGNLFRIEHSVLVFPADCLHRWIVTACLASRMSRARDQASTRRIL